MNRPSVWINKINRVIEHVNITPPSGVIRCHRIHPQKPPRIGTVEAGVAVVEAGFYIPFAIRGLESLPVVDVLTEGFAKGIVVQGMLYEVLCAVGIAVNELVGER